MNKIVIILLLVGAVAITGIYLNKPSKVTVCTADYFYIPNNCKNLGLLGCTPHPTHYLKSKGTNPESLKTIKIDMFLDSDYLRDSFDRTFAVCSEQGIDHLLIAYLPIYFQEMRQLLGDQFLPSCTLFLQRMSLQMPALIKESADRIGYTGQVTLIIPPLNQLARIPTNPITPQDRIAYLIKQFPKLLNRSAASLQTITIINNKASPEDDQLISYLKYEYLFEKEVQYVKFAIGKPRFHEGKNAPKK